MSGKTPLDFFNLFFNETVKNIIHNETNRYAEQVLTESESYLDDHPHARGHDWIRNPLKKEEINPFIAVIICMGIVGLPTLR